MKSLLIFIILGFTNVLFAQETLSEEDAMMEKVIVRDSIVEEIMGEFDNNIYIYSHNVNKKYESRINFDFQSWGSQCLVNITTTVTAFKFDSNTAEFSVSTIRRHLISRLNLSDLLAFGWYSNENASAANATSSIVVYSSNNEKQITYSWTDFSPSEQLTKSKAGELYAEVQFGFGMDDFSLKSLWKKLESLKIACRPGA